VLRKSETLSLWIKLLAASAGLLLILPLATSLLNQKDLNALLVLISITRFQAVFDIGFEGIITRLLGQANENINILTKNPQIGQTSTNEILAASRLIYIRLSIVVLFVFILITYISFSVNSFFNAQDFFNSKYFIPAIIVIISMSLNVRGKNRVAIMNAYGYLREQNYYRSFFILIGVITSILLGILTETLLAFMLYTIITELGCFYFNKYWVKKNLPKTQIDFSKYKSKQTYKYILKSSIKTGIGMIIGMSIIQGTGIYSTAIFSLKNSNMFLTYLNYISAIGKFANAPFQSKLPKLNRLYAQSQMKHFNTMYLSRLYYVSFLVAILSLIASFFIIIFFPAYEFNYILWLCLTLMIFAQRLGAINLQIYTVTNDIKWYFSNGITGLIALAFFYVLSPVNNLTDLVFVIIYAYIIFYIPYNSYLAFKVIKKDIYKTMPLFIITYSLLLALLII